MKPEELRLYNYVYDDANNIVQIDHQDIGEELYIFYKPIKLTEKILLKCGFEKEILEPIHYCIKGMCIWKCNDMFLCDKNGVHIKHLHQLQNLYFALTNEELKINL